MEQQRSLSGSSQSPRSPSSSQPFLSVSVTDPVKLGNGVQAYISYRVITKVYSYSPHSFLSIYLFIYYSFCLKFLIESKSSIDLRVDDGC